MKRLIAFSLALAVLCGCGAMNMSGGSATGAPKVATKSRATISFDKDWRFAKNDAPGAEKPEFSDSDWRELDVPHDWSIEGPFAQDAPTRGSGGSLPAGIGWYRKTFSLSPADAGKRIFIDFDGVMANSEVFINGKSLGKRPYGYSGFRYEMTGNLNFGQDKPNVLAVRADDSQQPASRFYQGAGIYRHVRLVVADPVHIDHWGTFITTPQATADRATVHVQNSVVNESNEPKQVSIQVDLIGPDGKRAATGESAPQTVPAGKSVDFQQDITVNAPKLWDVESPNLYQAVASVRANGKSIDDDVNTFGIRNFEFKSETGFWLNGKNFKLLGVCLHSDGGAFGMAVPAGVWERRLANLRELGCNAIRCAHNPPDPTFLDVCDRMGFLVMDETFDCWTVAKNPFDYHLYFREWNLIDVRDMVMRDRNHPSIVLYSAGNEIHDTPRADLAKSLLKPMVDEMHKWDPTRAVTQALFRPNADGDGGSYNNGLADMLDVIGTNYRDAELLKAWRDKPGRKIIGTEQQQGLDTWLNLRDNPQHSGQFLWAGIDYLGESQWPSTTSASGLLDRLGRPKPQGFERQAWWSPKPTVKIVRGEPGLGGRGAPARNPQAVPDGGFGDAGADRPRGQGAGPGAAAGGATSLPAGGFARGGAGARGAGARGPGARGGRGFGGPAANWTPRPTTTPVTGLTDVTVHSNCDEVELFVNGKSIGVKTKNANDAPRVFAIQFETGSVKAVGRNKGQVVASDELNTAGSPVKVLLTADQKTLTPTYDDVTFVTATIVDDKGNTAPYADNQISFKISGPGVIAIVDNADRVDHDPFQASQRKAYQGRAVAVIKAKSSSGAITIDASAEGLAGSSVTIQAAATR